MIVTVTELQGMPEFTGKSAEELQMLSEAIESLIRSYTHNNFQNRMVRIDVSCDGEKLNGSSPYISKGDTIQISTGINEGLYVVESVTAEEMFLNKSLFPSVKNLVTKVEYPPDIKLGVINLLKWEVNQRNKVGVKQETISRHSVTYFDQDSSNQVMGYPVSLLGFLKPYMKARF